MIWLLANWRWLLPAIAALGLGITLGITRIELTTLRGAVDRQKAEASQLLATRTQQVLDQERANADLNATLEATHAKSLVNAADADARVRAALRVRRNASGGACGAGPVSAGASAGKPEDAPSGGDSGLASPVDELVARTARAANDLAGYARECNAWVMSLNTPKRNPP